eukprot:5008643-Karenia_brevis.AAC.1
MLAPIKAVAASAHEAPDVRPIGVGECIRRAINSALMADMKPCFAQHFWPQQAAVGTPSGISLVIFGVRSLLELHPNWVVVRLDIRNAYNEIKRAAILRRLNASSHLRTLVPLFFATHSISSPVYLSGDGNVRA